MTIEDKFTEIEKLPVFKDENIVITYGRIPYDIHIELKTPKSSVVDEERPAHYSVTPNIGGGHSLSVWVWDRVPKNFVNVLLYHELKEAEFLLADGLSKEEAHNNAAELHIAYASRFLSQKDFQRFLRWQSQFEEYSDTGSFRSLLAQDS